MFAPEKDALAAHRRRIKGGRRGKVLAYTTIPSKVKCKSRSRCRPQSAGVRHTHAKKDKAPAQAASQLVQPRKSAAAPHRQLTGRRRAAAARGRRPAPAVRPAAAG